MLLYRNATYDFGITHSTCDGDNNYAAASWCERIFRKICYTSLSALSNSVKVAIKDALKYEPTSALLLWGRENTRIMINNHTTLYSALQF